MQLDTILRKALFAGFILMVIFNTLLIFECKNYSQKLERTKKAYDQRVFQLEKKIHDYGLASK